ncbi:hypothetical protein GTB64_004532 [Salmonella enterica]|nr:hypothetical protein [Salmonella enterica]
MTTQETNVRNLAALGQAKAHLEAVRRMQLAFEKELQAAGVKGADVTAALASLNSLITAREDQVSTDFDDVLFDLTK